MSVFSNSTDLKMRKVDHKLNAKSMQTTGIFSKKGTCTEEEQIRRVLIFNK